MHCITAVNSHGTPVSTMHCTGTVPLLPHVHRDLVWARPIPLGNHLHRDWAHPCSHLHKGLAHPARICNGTERSAACCWLQQGAPAMDARYMWMPPLSQYGPFPLVSPPPDSQICTGAGLAPNQICAGTQLTPRHFAARPAGPAPALFGTRAGRTPALICTRAWLIPPTSAPGLNAAPHAVGCSRERQRWTRVTCGCRQCRSTDLFRWYPLPPIPRSAPGLDSPPTRSAPGLGSPLGTSPQDRPGPPQPSSVPGLAEPLLSSAQGLGSSRPHLHRD
jgi:hypothetical protein